MNLKERVIVGVVYFSACRRRGWLMNGLERKGADLKWRRPKDGSLKLWESRISKAGLGQGYFFDLFSFGARGNVSSAR